MLRLAAIIPIVLSFTAFILSLLCLFAGSKVGFLENADLLTLNTSMLGQNFVKSKLSSSSSSSSSILSSIGKDVGKDVSKVASTVVSDIAKEINIHDFYSVHILDFCEGYYTPSPIINATSNPKKNITSCSNQTALFHFDPTTILQKELKPGVTLSDLQWPSAVENGIRAAELASKVMFVVYCIGIATTFLAFLGAVISFWTLNLLSALVNLTISMFACFCLMVASATATGIINKVVQIVNSNGNSIGLSATRGTTFVGMTWASDILMLLTGFVWLFHVFQIRKQGRAFIPEG